LGANKVAGLLGSLGRGIRTSDMNGEKMPLCQSELGLQEEQQRSTTAAKQTLLGTGACFELQ